MTDRRSRVLSSILSLAAMGNGMPIGLGVPGPGARLSFDDYGPRSLPRVTTRALHQAVRSPAEVERRKRRKAQRKARRGGR